MNLFYNTTRFFNILFLLFGFVLGQSQNQITLPYTESFEDGLGQFSQSTNDNFNWTRHSGSTPTFNTGPDSAADGNYYMYTEGGGIDTGDVANLLFGPFEVDPAVVVNAGVTFRYHMQKTNGGNLTFWSLALQVQESDDTWTTLWSRSEHQSTGWLTAGVDISNYLGSAIHLRFHRVRGSSTVGDAAIDNFQILENPSPNINGADIAFDVSLNTTTGNVDWTTRFSKDMALPTVAEFLATKALRVHSATNIVTADSGELLSIRYGETDGAEDKSKLIFEIDVPEDESGYLVRMQYNDTGHDNSGLTDLAGNAFAGSNASNGYVDTTALSIDDLALKGLVLYPNPVGKSLQIQSPLAEAMSYTVYDLTGKALSTHHKTGQSHSIDVSGLAKGVYLLEATHNNSTTAMQFVKE